MEKEGRSRRKGGGREGRDKKEVEWRKKGGGGRTMEGKGEVRRR